MGGQKIGSHNQTNNYINNFDNIPRHRAVSPGDQVASVSGSISSSKRSSEKNSRSSSPTGVSRSAQRFINILPENQVSEQSTSTLKNSETEKRKKRKKRKK